MHTIEFTTGNYIFIALLLLYWILSTILHIYGIVHCFKKKWYLGAAALLIPGFAWVIAIAKLVFKKDLLENS